MMVVVSAEVVLHALAAVDHKVVVGVVKTAAVVVVHILLGRIVVDEELGRKASEEMYARIARNTNIRSQHSRCDGSHATA